MTDSYTPFPTDSGGNTTVRQPRNGLGIAALVLGCASLIIGVLGAIPGVICGVLGMRRVSSGDATNKGVTLTGLIVSAVMLVWGIVGIVLIVTM